MGYHKTEIPKGTLGEFSKIEEEFNELRDAHSQSNKVLEICELSDMLGAIEAYAAKWNLSLADLEQMQKSTASAFNDGQRS